MEASATEQVVGKDKPEVPAVGNAVKATQQGALPIGTVHQILSAPSDIIEDVLPVPEWGFSVKVRSFTSSQSAEIKEKMYVQKGEEVKVAWTPMEIEKFKQGVVEPQFSEDEAKRLHRQSGPGFQRVLQWLDDKSGIREEDVRAAQEEFQNSGK